ncbi:MAG: surface-adhesin E family protein [Cyanobacteriota bacterium]
MKRFLLIIFFILLIQPVCAQNWELVAKNDTVMFFIDISAIENESGSISYSEKGIFKNTQVKDVPPWDIPFISYIAKRNLDCINKTVTNIKVTTYQNDNIANIEYYFDIENSTSRIKKDSFEDFVYKKICNP